MKKFLLSIASLLSLVTVNAQFKEDFNTATISSLTASCWVLNGVSTTTQSGEAIEANSIYTAPPTNPGVKIDLYTPVLTFSTTSTVISLDYRITQNLASNATRTIQVGLVNMAGILVTSQLINIDANTSTGINHFQYTFSGFAAGNYRVVMRITGALGSGNVRLVLDNFQATNAIVTNTSGNCVLVPIQEIALPVKLMSFEAKYIKPAVSLNWTTAQEHNFSHFILEQSTDGTVFSQVSLIFGAGETDDQQHYSYTDRNLTGRKGLIYYRLKSVDTDGKYTYSSIRIIRLDDATNDLSIMTYPNPAANELKITIPASWQNKKLVYEMISINGQSAKRFESANSSQTESINISSLQPGIYLVKVTCEGTTVQNKIVKQ